MTPGLVQMVTVTPGQGECESVTFANTYQPPEGCTPGFWQGGEGAPLWDTESDPDWTAVGGDGSNPFIHTTLFNDFFATHTDLDGLTMMDLIGTGGGAKPARKAAHSLVAAYLNASFGMDYVFTTTQLDDMWTAAVAGGNPALMDLHKELDAANKQGCPFP